MQTAEGGESSDDDTDNIEEFDTDEGMKSTKFLRLLDFRTVVNIFGFKYD